MAQSTISIRVDEDLKKRVEALADAFGMNLTTLVTVFLKAVEHERRIPFEITAEPNDVTKAAIDDVINGRNMSRVFDNVDEMMAELMEGIDEVKRNKGEKFTIKQMEKMKKSLEVRLDKLNDQSRKDDVVTFEELGVDRLFIDEAHYFRTSI